MSTKIVTISILSIVLLFLSVSLFAQDTLVVPSDYVNIDGNTTGSLNQFIADDIADGGVPEGRVYLLKRGEFYLLSGQVDIEGFKFRLVGEKEPAATHPAVVSAGLKEDGSELKRYFNSLEDVEFRNIYFKGSNPTDILTGRCLRIVQPDKQMVVDNCVFDSFHEQTLWFNGGPGARAYITNSYFRNQNPGNGGIFGGTALRFWKSTPDTIVMRNNTFVNSNGIFLNLDRRDVVDYCLVDHNTIVNTITYAVQWNWQTNATFTNNLFYNCNSYGESISDAFGRDTDNLQHGIFTVDTIAVDSIISEADRNVTITNNSWYYDAKVNAYWDARDSVRSAIFMNDRTQSMFDNDADWPGLLEENNMNEGVNFTLFPDVTDGMIALMNADRDVTEKVTNWGYYPDNSVYQIYWPLETIEDLSYLTSDPAYTAGTGGFPLGNLNHFPDKKAEWENGLIDEDTLVVPSDYVNIDGNTTGSLNQFIADDIADGGVPEGRVYLLKRGEFYLLSGQVDIEGFKFRLVGEKEPAATHPAVVSAGLKEDGSGLKRYFNSLEDVEFRNIYFKGSNPTDILTGRCLRIVQPDKQMVVDNCVFDSFHEQTLWFNGGPGARAYITNSYFRNQNPGNGGIFGGTALRFWKSTPDTIVMRNNTFVNSNGIFLNLDRRDVVDYCLVDHNTIVNTITYAVQWNWQTNATFTNNLFYNCNSYGESISDAFGRDTDNLQHGIFAVDTIAVDSIISEADRNVRITNNSWFYDEKVHSYWDARDSVRSAIFMNDRTQSMFDNDVDWPGLLEENNMNEGVNFTLFPDVTDGMIALMNADRDVTEKVTNWGYYPDNSVFQIYWPLKTIEDLSYSTSDPAYTAGTGEFPLGNLNHFPDKMTEWKAWLPTGIEANSDITTIPMEYSLKQNYPNPFNPSTVIGFSIPEKNNVSLDVFNTLGQKVRSLVNEELKTGIYKYTLNSTGLSSGVYFYRLKVGNSFTQIKKMIFMK